MTRMTTTVGRAVTEAIMTSITEDRTVTLRPTTHGAYVALCDEIRGMAEFQNWLLWFNEPCEGVDMDDSADAGDEMEFWGCDDDGDEMEFWGCDDDGDTWRVHVSRTAWESGEVRS